MVRYTFYKEEHLDINLEHLANFVIESIQKEFNSSYPDDFDWIVDYYLTDGYEELELYDNYQRVLHTIMDDLINWCAENKPEWYKMIGKYIDFVAESDRKRKER